MSQLRTHLGVLIRTRAVRMSYELWSAAQRLAATRSALSCPDHPSAGVGQLAPVPALIIANHHQITIPIKVREDAELTSLASGSPSTTGSNAPSWLVPLCSGHFLIRIIIKS